MRNRLSIFSWQFLLPLAMGLTVAAGAFVIWGFLMDAERSRSRDRAETYRSTLVADLEDEIGTRRLALARLATRRSMAGESDSSAWRSDASHYLEHYPALSSLTWVTPQGEILWRHARDDTSRVARPEVELPPRDRQRVVTGPGVGQITIEVPSAEDGVLLAVFDRNALLRAALNDHMTGGYGFAIRGPEGELFSHGPQADRSFASEGEVDLAGINWQATTWLIPTADDRVLTPLPHIVLAAGLLLAVMLATSLYLAQAARRDRGEAESAYRRLRKQVSERERVDALLNAVLESTPDAVFVKDLDGRYETLNAACGRILGGTPDEIVGRRDDEFLPEEIVEQVRANDRAVLASGDTMVVEETVPVGDEERIFLSTKGVVRDPEGQAIGTFGLARDVTERMRVREELAAHSRMLATIIDAQEAIGSTRADPDEVRREALVWAQRLTRAEGALVEDIRGDHVAYVAASGMAEDLEGVEVKLAGSLSGLTVATEEVQLSDDCDTDPRVNRDTYGELEIRSMLIVPLRYEGETTGVVKVLSSRPNAFGEQAAEGLRLLSGLMAASLAKAKAHAALTRLKMDLERSNRELEQFAYVASHDLQEPLRMVSSYTQLLERRYADQLDDEAREFIDFAVDGANRMQTLINDLLQFSRIGTRKHPLAPTDLNRVLGQARAALRHSIDDKRALVTNDELPTVTADGQQLVQLFQNLIANGVKFHRDDERPRVHVSCRETENEWVISVRDNGIGIEPQYFKRIFDIFQRLHTRGEFSGTGIGLAICQRIVDRHGGRIWVESEPGQGSTFLFTIPKDIRGEAT